MVEPHACPDCLRRSWLLALLGPCVERFPGSDVVPSALELLKLGNEDLVAKVAPKVASQLLARIDSLSEDHLEEELSAADCWACCAHGDLYPAQLCATADAPRALIGRGNPTLLRAAKLNTTVTVVGARRATSYGREVARELGRDLASAGMIVVSGLAFGVDACAHRGALDAGHTIAVLGCGPDISYPAAHRSLWRRITEQGLVISEFPPGAAHWRWTFPARNRIMAALAGMTVVVEAATNSGSLVTAALAADLGRDLGAVPGPVTSRASAGPNNLLAGGACLVRNAQDVLDALELPSATGADAPDDADTQERRYERLKRIADDYTEQVNDAEAQAELGGQEPVSPYAFVTSEGAHHSNGNLVVCGTVEEFRDRIASEAAEGWITHGRTWDLSADEFDIHGNITVELVATVRASAGSGGRAV